MADFLETFTNEAGCDGGGIKHVAFSVGIHSDCESFIRKSPDAYFLSCHFGCRCQIRQYQSRNQGDLADLEETEVVFRVGLRYPRISCR